MQNQVLGPLPKHRHPLNFSPCVFQLEIEVEGMDGDSNNRNITLKTHLKV